MRQSNWYDFIIDDIGLEDEAYNHVKEALKQIIQAEREDAVNDIENPPISEFVADNFARDILAEIEYSDIIEYVADCESTKDSDNYDYQSERGV